MHLFSKVFYICVNRHYNIRKKRLTKWVYGMQEKRKPIVEALEKFQRERNYSFHVPGHKHGKLSRLPEVFREVMRYDLTELTGLDDYHHPEEVILDAQRLLQQTYGADESFFLVNGSTVGNLAMIYATCKRGDEVIVQRNAHKSIFHGLQLVGARPIYITPEWDERTKTAAHVSPNTLLEALQAYPYAKAVILTYPTYYGVTTKHLQQMINDCHAYDVPVLVDEAHGAHLAAYGQFPKSALACGADVVVQSAHKTLPAMTMASFLHVKSQLVSIDSINHYLRMLQSSSPSYLLLASLDDARHYVQTYLASDGVYYLEKRQQWVDSLKTIRGLEVIEVDDPLKVLLRVPGYTGFELKNILEQYKIYVELADSYQVLLVLPLLKHGQIYPFADIRVKIKEVVATLLKQQRMELVFRDNAAWNDFSKTIRADYTYEEMSVMEREWVPYVRALGRTSAEMIIPYPPGIPLFLPGEKISVAKLSQLEELLAMGVAFQGTHRLQEKCICVLKQ